MNRFNPYAAKSPYPSPFQPRLQPKFQASYQLKFQPKFQSKFHNFQSGGLIKIAKKDVPNVEIVEAAKETEIRESIGGEIGGEIGDKIDKIDEIDEIDFIPSDAQIEKADLQRVQELNSKILIAQGRLHKLGIDISDLGQAPRIPSRYMERSDYVANSETLATKADDARDAYRKLTGFYPTLCPSYAIALYERDAERRLSPEVYNAAMTARDAVRDFNYFMEDYTPAELSIMRQDALILVEKIYTAKLELRSLQYHGVDIGTAIFDD